MKKIRLVLTILICLVLALCVLVACNKGDGEPSVDPSDSTGTDTGGEHQHTFAKEWSSNDEYHWHAATCGHDTEQADVATHTFQQIDYTAPTCTEPGSETKQCSICDKIVIEPIDATGHSFSETWSNDNAYHWKDAICGHTVTSEMAPHNFGNDNTCDTCGYERVVGASVLEVQNGQIQGLNIFMLVEPTVADVPLAQAVKVSDGCVWTLSYDKIGNDVINSKVATQKDGQLVNGDNTFYIVVSSQFDPSLISVYTVTIHRSYLTQISYHFKNSVVHTQQFYTGNEVQAEWTPDFTGYTFNCWRDDDEEQYVTQTLWAPLDLYADATANSYNVTLDVNDGDSLNQTQYSVSYDSEFTLPTPTREGHTFLGWYNGSDEITDGTNTNIEAWNIADDVQLQAHWQINDYTLGVEVSGNACGSVQGGGTFTYGNSVTLTATTNLGYIFLGWYEGESMLSDELVYTFDMPAKSTTYTATWAMDEAMSPFVFTSTPTTCIITGVKDSAVTDIVVPSYVTSIGSGAFANCKSLESITLPFVGANTGLNNTTHFGYIFGASSYSSNNIYVPTSLKKVVITGGASIGNYAFCHCDRFTSIIIPSTVTSIGTYAFYDCGNLQTVIFDGDSQLQSIGDYAFRHCSNLMEITIPSTVTSIGDSAFSDCSNLPTVTFDDDSQLQSIGSYAFDGCSSLTEITIPSTVTSIGDSAFSDCSNLPTVTFDDDSQLQSIGEGAFKGCSSLESITLPFVGQNSDGTGATHFGYIFGAKDADANKTSVPTSLKKVVITGGASIVANAFYNCGNLTEITIPSTVTSIGDYAFSGCSNLQTVTFDGDSQLQSIGEYAFNNCSGLTEITIPSSVTSIGASAFRYCSSLTEITIPSTVTSIGKSAFSGCSKLTEITIPSTVTSINNYAFNGCSNLTEITIPSKVTRIGPNAFYNCSNLAKVIFQDPTGWSSGGSALSGLDDPATAATYLTSTYFNYTWKKS